jgi:hypothetical protein
MATGGAGGSVVRYQLVHGSVELCLVGASDPAARGAFLSRPIGADAWSERGVLAEVGADGAVAPGRGYYLAYGVTTG